MSNPISVKNSTKFFSEASSGDQLAFLNEYKLPGNPLKLVKMNE